MKKLIFVFCLLLPLPVSGQGWLFQRSTTTYKTFSAGGAHPTVSHMSEVEVDHPRVAGKGGGLLVEGQSTNNITYSQQFQQAGSWTVGRLSVVADSAISLDGTTTVDTLHEDGTLANTHYIVQGGIPATNGNVYTGSAYVKTINRDWVSLNFWGAGILSHTVYFNVSNGTVGTLLGVGSRATIETLPDGYCRCSMTATATGTGNFNLTIYIAEADNDNNFDGLDQDSLYVWQAQVEEQPFPTSPILTTTVPVTRTADDMTLDPHPDGTNEIVLPELFSPTGPASKLTVYLETKCQFTDSTDIGENRHVFEISGDGGTASATRNRLFVQFGTDGRIYYYFRDDAVSDHYIYTAVNPVDLTEWHTHRVVIDFADYSRIDAWLDGDNSGMLYSGNAGSGSFDTTETEIRLGQTNSGVVNGHCRVRNIRITPSEIRAP